MASTAPLRTVAQPDAWATATRQFLLASGIAAPVLWIAADVLASLLYPGYRYASQAPSELSAIGAPTRGLLTVTGVFYDLLMVLFGLGIWSTARSLRALQVASILVVAQGAVGGVGWYLSPMHMRGAAPTTSDTMHVVMAAFTVGALLLTIGFGAAGLGRAFRIFSAMTFVLLLVFGLLTARYVPQVASNAPTPGLGLVERTSVYAGMLWLAVFALVLLRRGEPDRPRA